MPNAEEQHPIDGYLIRVILDDSIVRCKVIPPQSVTPSSAHEAMEGVSSTLCSIVMLTLGNKQIEVFRFNNYFQYNEFNCELANNSDAQKAFDVTQSIIKKIEERVADGMDITAALSSLGGVNPHLRLVSRDLPLEAVGVSLDDIRAIAQDEERDRKRPLIDAIV